MTLIVGFIITFFLLGDDQLCLGTAGNHCQPHHFL